MSKGRLIIMSVISIVLVSILLIGSTYSIFTSEDIAEDANVYTTGNLDISYTLSSSNVQMTDSTPMTEEEADSVIPYRITVTNSGNVPYKFNVVLSDTTASNVIDYQYIMTKVGYLDAKALGDCTDNVIVGDIVLLAGTSVDIDVRVWLDSTLPNTEMGKSFYAKLSIDGLAVYDDNDYIDNSILSLRYMKSLFVLGGSKTYFRAEDYVKNIKNALFVDYINTENAVSDSTVWDVSEKGDNSVIAWLEANETEGYYDLYIGTDRRLYSKDLKAFFAGMETLENISFDNLDTSLVTDIRGMFEDCKALVNLDLSSFDTSNVIFMSPGYNYGNLFQNCTSLVNLNLSGWNTSKVTQMARMFWKCTSLVNIDLGGFDTSSVTDMSGMFEGCSSLTSLDLSNFNTSNVTNMGAMFYGCSSLITLNISNFVTNKVTNMKTMFRDCSKLTSLDVSNFDTSIVTTMQEMFYDCSKLTSLDTIGFNTGNVTNMGGMFEGCSSLTYLDVSNFVTNEVTNMNNIFYGCSKLTSLDVSNWNTGGVTSMVGVFYNCSSLTYLDLSNWDTSKVTNMSNMFRLCTNLATTITIRNTGTSTYTTMFHTSATESGAKITVNYTSSTSSLVDSMIATKSANSNVVKGSQV